ncbi:MAG: AmmeMemoRadiSam system protein B [Candidatus Taylorbacteria bacterium]|nr:AmmeMemoRadiSam system protein B [Candidatus Taylorbacteria bacterium]
MNKVLTIIVGVLLVIIGGYAIYSTVSSSTRHFVASDAQGHHSSMYYYDNVDFFPQSVQAFEKTKPLAVPPRIFIVNQHILAAHVIAQQFALVADPKVTRVILITQNNWTVGRSPIITSRYGWKTHLGDIEADTKFIDVLAQKDIAVVDEDIFTTEHGITGIVSYIAHAFPHAKIIPLVVRDDISNTSVDVLADQISQLDMTDTVVIGSIDGSHYLPQYVADIHDRLTIQAIASFDYEVLPRLDIDTVPTLRTILKVAEAKKKKTFVQIGGINSADIVGDPELMITTSYFSGYFTDEKFVEKEPYTHVLFVGDIMLDRGVALHAEKYGVDSLFGKIERLFLGTHAVVGNLEGTITDNESIARKNNSILRFTFNPLFTDLLKKLKITAVSLANNHSGDFGGDGFRQTKNNLNERGIISFGSSRNDTSLSSTLLLNGKEVCLIGYHDLYTFDPTSVLAEITATRAQCSYIVVMPHWGVEYTHEPTERQKTLAHKFIDAGADLVIGAHPHVVQPVEIYKNKAIFYSLGNFMFDQDFSYATRQGLAVHIELGNEETRYNLIPISISRAEVAVAEPADRTNTLSIVAGTNLPNKIRSAILKSQSFILWNHNQINSQ